MENNSDKSLSPTKRDNEGSYPRLPEIRRVETGGMGPTVAYAGSGPGSGPARQGSVTGRSACSWRGFGGGPATPDSVDFDRQLDKISLWLEHWNHETVSIGIRVFLVSIVIGSYYRVTEEEEGADPEGVVGGGGHTLMGGGRQ